MPASTLLSTAQRASIRALPSITDVADIPYRLLHPILKSITNPTQLHNLEIASPALADHTAGLWRAFIRRDVSLSTSDGATLEPKNPRSWWKVYRKLMREEEERREAQEAALRKTMDGLSAKREATRNNFVDKIISQRRTINRPCFVDGVPNAAALISASPMSAAGIAVRKAKRSRDLMNTFRRQAGEDLKSRSSGMVMKTTTTRVQISKAPQSMLLDHRKVTPVVATARKGGAERRHTPAAFAPAMRVLTARDRALNEALKPRDAIKENRLLALTRPVSKMNHKSPTPTHPAATPSAIALSPTAVKPATPLTKTVCPASITPKDAKLEIDSAAAILRSPSPLPAMTRKRPARGAVSVFMPAKKRKLG